MDANGLRCFQIADAAAFGFLRPEATAPRDLHWRADARLLRLDRLQAAPELAEDAMFARGAAARPSLVGDALGSYAWWDPAAQTLVTGGFAPGAVPLPLPPDQPPGVAAPTDLAFGDDDVLYVARNDAVLMVDRRDRWRPARVVLAGFAAHRLAPAPGGGVWALDRSAGRIARLTGYPLRVSGIFDERGERFRAEEPNPRPPRLRRISAAQLPAGHDPVAIAASPGGRVAVLTWRSGAEAVLFTLEAGRLVRCFALAGLAFPYALAWNGEASVAALASDGARPAAQAFVYELDTPPSAEGEQRPTGAVHPLLDPWHGGFCNTLAETPSYPTADGAPDRPGGLRPLHALSRATYARSGHVTLGPFDCGGPGAVWHRVYLEASIPDRAGLRLWAVARDTATVPPAPGAPEAPGWALHLAGAAAALPEHAEAPRAAWLHEASEMPFDPGLLVCPSAPGRSGLFTILLQRPGLRVRRLRGRYLFLHLELLGDSQVTPEVAAIRVYPARFSYRDRYLPDLYGETVAGPEADAAARATPPDFLDRFLGIFEGALTQLEDKVAASWLLTDPAAAPASALPWLAHWVGIDPAGAATARQLRQMLVAAPWTARLHGSAGGVLAALELATGGRVVIGGWVDPRGAVPRPGTIALADRDGQIVRVLMLHTTDPERGGTSAFLSGGAVTGGEIVLVEGFRLRRTFATILGADLSDAENPLTLGLSRSGNSFIGDTLILGDETRREFLSLFAADLELDRRDSRAIAAFFERLAHRQMVLVRPTARTADRARIAATAADAAPAHVRTDVFEATRPLIVAAASLVGIDTFLTDEPETEAVRLGRSRLGLGDQVRGTGRLDPRADVPRTPPPVAVGDGPAEAYAGSAFWLTAARSTAAPGRHIVRNIWTWN